MKRTALGSAAVPELVDLFVSLCVEQGEELERGDIPRVNCLFDEINAVEEELKTRPGDRRHALVPLYKHDDMQVRLTAAKATLAIAPEAARKALQDIKASKWLPQSAEASGTLWTLDRGIFKPT